MYMLLGYLFIYLNFLYSLISAYMYFSAAILMCILTRKCINNFF